MCRWKPCLIGVVALPQNSNDRAATVSALANLTIGGQSVLCELFQKHLECADADIRRLELTYFALAITTAVYLRLGKESGREQTLDEVAKAVLKGSLPSAREQITLGEVVCQYQGRYAEYDQLLLILIDKSKSSTGNPDITLLLHLFECVTGQSGRTHMLRIAALAPLIEGYVLDHIEFVKTGH